MRRIFRGLGFILCALGVLLIAANIAMSHYGLEASYNVGDPAKFEFVLVPMWLTGVVALVIGAAIRDFAALGRPPA